MKEIRSIIQAYQSLDPAGTRAALATVARVEGSSYRRAGARMLVREDGTFVGGISGGCLEGDALRRAQKAIAQNKPSVVTYDTTQEDSHQIGVGLGCNGIIDVLFTPLTAGGGNHPVQLLERVAGTRTPRLMATVLQAEGHPGLLGRAVLLETEEEFRLSLPVEELAGPLLADARQCLEKETSQTKQYLLASGSLTVFLEVLVPDTHLVLCGGNYDIYPLVRMAGELGWKTTVVMNPARADKSLFEMADVHPASRPQLPVIDRYTAVVLMAHDYEKDFTRLQAVLPTAARYIGLLGPRKRSQKMFDALAATGAPLSEANLQRIHAPAGLDIGAATPEEIALSILAEIRAHFNGRAGMPLRQRSGTIYGD